MIHSPLVKNASLRAFSFLNRVSIDVFFVVKTFLEQWPVRTLFVCLAVNFCFLSWSLRACTYYANRKHWSMSDAMWNYVITFSTVGYGDIFTQTYCGRAVATLIVMSGLLCSALIIAVLTQKLVLSREEKYVHTFVLNTELVKRRRHHAANVVIFALKIWYLRRRHRHKHFDILMLQKKIIPSNSTFASD